MTTDAFQTDWLDLKTAIAEGRVASPKSAMWSNLIKDFDASGSDALSAGRRSYNFLRLDSETAGARAEKLLLSAAFLASVAFKRLSGALWNYNLNGVRHGWLVAYPRFNRVMRDLGLSAEYADFCAERGLTVDNFNAAKLFYISRQTELDSLPASPAILEVGGGTGTLAVLQWLKRKPKLYVIVDLPEMLLHSSRTIHHMIPDAPTHFAHRMPAGPLTLPSSGFLFVPHTDAARLPAGAFDLCLNIDSLQEMSREQVEGYMKLFGRAGRAGALMMTLNRRKTVGGWDNNPLVYPYPPSDILRWETDPFMLNTLRAERKDSWLLRFERLKGTNAA